MNISRFIFLAALALLAALNNAHAQAIAFTFDDGPYLAATPKLSAVARNQSLLDHLAKHRVKATLFVTVDNGANRPEGLALARAWGEAGHTIGNHTMTHLDLNSKKITLADYQQELLDCDAVIRTLPGYRKWFRFTYLREGNTPEKRDGMRAFLAAQNYRNAYVSLDTSDWRLNDKLVEVLSKNANADIAPIKRAYLAHVWQRAEAYRALSQKLQGRDIVIIICTEQNLGQLGFGFINSAYRMYRPRTAADEEAINQLARELEKKASWEEISNDPNFARSIHYKAEALYDETH